MAPPARLRIINVSRHRPGRGAAAVRRDLPEHECVLMAVQVGEADRLRYIPLDDEQAQLLARDLLDAAHHGARFVG